jgi:hypothetical protein
LRPHPGADHPQRAGAQIFEEKFTSALTQGTGQDPCFNAGAEEALVRDCISKIRPAIHPTQMHALIRRLLIVAAVLAVGSSAVAQTTTLISEAKNSAVWYSSSGNQTILSTFTLASDGKLSVGDGQHALTYFTPSKLTQQPVNAGQSIQATFDLSITGFGTSSGGFRVGLFDSNGGTRPTGNSVSTAFQNYDGYVFSWTPNPGTASNALNLRKRLTTGSTSLLSTTASTTYQTYALNPDPDKGEILADSILGSANRQNFQIGTVYAATYTLSRYANNGLEIEFSVTGGGSTWNFGKLYSITQPGDLAFDAFALYYVGGAFTVDNLVISHIGAAGATAIPEPSTYAACAGAAVLGLAFWRRRRAAAQGGSS